MNYVPRNARYASQFTLHENEIQSTNYYVRNYKLFMQNKPNLVRRRRIANSVYKRIYNNFIPLAGQKNKPNTNPIKPNLQKAKIACQKIRQICYPKNIRNISYNSK